MSGQTGEPGKVYTLGLFEIVRDAMSAGRFESNYDREMATNEALAAVRDAVANDPGLLAELGLEQLQPLIVERNGVRSDLFEGHPVFRVRPEQAESRYCGVELGPEWPGMTGHHAHRCDLERGHSGPHSRRFRVRPDA